MPQKIKKIAEKFKDAFGDKLITIDCEYIDYDYDKAGSLCQYTSERENDRYIRGLDYVVSMLFLSKCPGFITSYTSGAVGVMCLSEGFDYLYIFNLGRY
ncbi:MAG: hypothetical protein II884_04415 [Synergistaceae bacterium]|nr:hypothetical protein [Synergistaceae bacterium]MBQ3693998.1 hypothetical protein [Synergistaceae bacterium]